MFNILSVTTFRYFEYQLTLHEAVRLPLFLHCRNAASDLVDILFRKNQLVPVNETQ
jgi:TatD DNase family protein